MIQIISLALPIALAATVPSDPYVRSRATETCPHASAAACLYWPAGTVVFNQSELGNPPTGSSLFAAVTKSWQSWQSILDGCGNLTLTEGPRVADRTIGYQKGSSNNSNVTVFRTKLCSAVVPANDPCKSSGSCNNQYDCWDDFTIDRNNTIALTTTTYESCTGRILDADLEFNAATFKFTTVDSPPCPRLAPNYNCVATDVQNTATHEFGHSLGLDHTNWRDPSTGQSSTMSPSANVGDLDKRVVDNGSRQFICMVYPKGGASRGCLNTDSSGCSTTSGAPMVLAAAAWLVGRRKSRGRLCDQ